MSTPVHVTFAHVHFAYPGGPEVVSGVETTIAPGEVALVVGASGSGKSTLLRMVNGLVPHSSGGRFSGDVLVGDRSAVSCRPRDLAATVGFVHQDPEAQFVVDRVEADVAFVLENLGYTPQAMRRRVEEVLDALGIAHLRDRSPATLSGGERQRAAIAGALASGPGVLVLDEPTSELDPQGVEDVLAAVSRLNTDLGTTVLLAEHRLERAAPAADRALVMDAGRVVAEGPPTTALTGYPGAPPVTHLGRLLGWDPIPLTVRDARHRARHRPPSMPEHPPARDRPVPGEVLVEARSLALAHGANTVLSGVDLVLHRGTALAVLGRNGSGKTTLLRALAGLHPPATGEVATGTSRAYVPQDPNTLLFAPTVRQELCETLRLRGQGDHGQVDAWLSRLGLSAQAEVHPRSLSAGGRQRTAVAAVAVGGAEVLVLDEPTRGIDAPSAAAVGFRSGRAHPRRWSGGSGHPRRRVGRRGGRPGAGPGRRRGAGPRCGSRGAGGLVVRAPGAACTAPLSDRGRRGPRPGGRQPSGGAVSPAGRTRLVYVLVTIVGVAAFTYPFWLPARLVAGEAHSDLAPFLTAVLAALVVVAVSLELRLGVLNGTAVALLGVLAAATGLLRLLDFPGGGSGLFFLLLLGGAAMGPRLGFVLGLTSMVLSALLTGGVGPWLPFQMLGAGWMGAAAGLVGHATHSWSPRARLWALAGLGWCWGFFYGAILNLWSWPFLVGEGDVSWQPGMGWAQTLAHYHRYYVTTSLAWDTAGAFANAMTIVVLGGPLLASLTRVSRRLAPVLVVEETMCLDAGCKDDNTAQQGKPVRVRR